ncbi:hypothetical protein CDAR_399301 [Caerostris darwini]|uniref:Uncharacterized protein n=1 Tax=Caerostris darwini TaxID=1538125 RepID=A0AAV4SXX5_9ARAC|nr:hypothetical protein CDAR_399301 [Caerostris darwini]
MVGNPICDTPTTWLSTRNPFSSRPPCDKPSVNRHGMVLQNCTTDRRRASTPSIHLSLMTFEAAICVGHRNAAHDKL